MAYQHIDESEQRSFHKLLIDISEQIKKEELETLKFYCSHLIPAARLEDINSPLQLWEALMDKGCVSSADTTFLQELMENPIKRDQLRDRVIQYANRVHVPPQSGGLTVLYVICFLYIYILFYIYL